MTVLRHSQSWGPIERGTPMRILQSADVAACQGCHRQHAPGEPHRGSPSDWNPDAINGARHRELGGDVERVIEDMLALSQHESWNQALAHAIERRPPCVHFRRVGFGTVECGEDQTLFLAPIGAAAVLRCGIILHVSSRAAVRLEAPAEFSAVGAEPLLFAGYTGVLADITLPGPKLPARLVRTLRFER